MIITYILNKKNFENIKYLYLILTLFNSLLLFDNFKIQKPKLSFLINNLDATITKNYFTNEGNHKGYNDRIYKDVYDYYFKKSFILKKKFNNIDKNFINDYEKIYFICLNHPEMHVGKDKSIQRNDKCNNKFDEFYTFSEKEIKDFKILLLVKD